MTAALAACACGAVLPALELPWVPLVLLLLLLLWLLLWLLLLLLL
mgnify:CR=1 FL=1